MGMDGFWFAIYPDLTPDIDEAKEKFLFVLKTLLDQGKVKLAHDGQFLKGSTDEQIQAFREKWPSWDNFDNDLFYITKNYEIKGKTYADFWLPGGLVWIGEDGHQHWT